MTRFLASVQLRRQAKVWDESNATEKLPDAGYAGSS